MLLDSQTLYICEYCDNLDAKLLMDKSEMWYAFSIVRTHYRHNLCQAGSAKALLHR